MDDCILEFKTHRQSIEEQQARRRKYFAEELEQDKKHLEYLINYARKAKFGDLYSATEIVQSIIHRQKIINAKSLLI